MLSPAHSAPRRPQSHLLPSERARITPHTVFYSPAFMLSPLKNKQVRRGVSLLRWRNLHHCSHLCPTYVTVTSTSCGLQGARDLSPARQAVHSCLWQFVRFSYAAYALLTFHSLLFNILYISTTALNHISIFSITFPHMTPDSLVLFDLCYRTMNNTFQYMFMLQLNFGALHEQLKPPKAALHLIKKQ